MGPGLTQPSPPPHPPLLESSAPLLHPHLAPGGCGLQRRLTRWHFSGKLTASGPGHALPPRPGSRRFWDRTTRGRQTAGQGPQTPGARRGPYTWPLGSVSSRPFLQTQDGKVTPGMFPSLQFHPPRPAPDPALTSLRRRRAPPAQEAQAWSTAQQPPGNASQGHLSSGRASGATTANLEEQGRQSGVAPTGRPGPWHQSPLSPVPT